MEKKPQWKIKEIRDATKEENEWGLEKMREQEAKDKEIEARINEQMAVIASALQHDMAEDARRSMRNLTILSLTVLILWHLDWPINELKLLNVSLDTTAPLTYKAVMLAGLVYFLVGFLVRYVRSNLVDRYKSLNTNEAVAIKQWGTPALKTVNSLFKKLRVIDAIFAVTSSIISINILIAELF